MIIKLKNKDTLICDDFKFKCSIGKNGLKKKLMGVKIESDSISITETIKIFDNNENHIGELRSGVYSPHFNKVIGIAMLKKPNWNTGTKIKININGKSVNGTVCDLPFI